MSIDLAKFCSDSRVEIARPFGVINYTIATDGCLMLIVDRPCKTTNAIPAGRVEALIAVADANAFSPDAEWMSADRLHAPDGPKCLDCDGSGQRFRVECGDCDGDGSFWHDSHYYDCRSCDGSGAIVEEAGPCRHCRETGLSHHPIPSPVHDRIGINAVYVALLRTLPECELRVDKFFIPKDGEEASLIMVRFKGGRGVLTGMKT